MSQVDVINELSARLSRADREATEAKERAQAAEEQVLKLQQADALAKSLSEQYPKMEKALLASRERENRLMQSVQRLEGLLAREQAHAETASAAADAKISELQDEIKDVRSLLNPLAAQVQAYESDLDTALGEIERLKTIEAAAIEDLKTRDALRGALG